MNFCIFSFKSLVYDPTEPLVKILKFFQPFLKLISGEIDSEHGQTTLFCDSHQQ